MHATQYDYIDGSVTSRLKEDWYKRLDDVIVPPSSSSSSSADGGSQKKVTFNLVESDRSKRKNMETLLDVGRLAHGNPWESYYGSNPGKQLDASGRRISRSNQIDGFAATTDYQNIFNSPYFDYRKTHSQQSQVSSMQHTLLYIENVAT